ncbi:hypothetical protein VNO77_23204 [Canavalia gladiata]|uniref:Uncharacterized protein n=1 Tax=Canavalia gladiata TaxID=3824 RepID=A0AAN9QBP0_CANGL
MALTRPPQAAHNMCLEVTEPNEEITGDQKAHHNLQMAYSIPCILEYNTKAKCELVLDDEISEGGVD